MPYIDAIPMLHRNPHISMFLGFDIPKVCVTSSPTVPEQHGRQGKEERRDRLPPFSAHPSKGFLRQAKGSVKAGDCPPPLLRTRPDFGGRIAERLVYQFGV